MSSLRLGDVEWVVEHLLHAIFRFDDARYPVGGSTALAPYFPNSASSLVVTAMMGSRLDGSEALERHWPKSSQKDVHVEVVTRRYNGHKTGD
ncbi:uncharacterized protein C8A04DRAFT_28175 [Dichotomopilus funicola]|uniref:Uncharacterized protein n=1 Tax=Dichotomopilus funicola TaxID=1934379 RepID=A0AAN6V4S8_9PEZI|nr:hypothetical protein C8A04DRAFT_28175 [Dichotomopilus funicola]